MLKQLEDLSLNAEGRYATAQELKFIKDFLPTVDLRLSAYRKIRDAEDEIIEQLETEMRRKQPNIFQTKSGDVSPLYQRDTKIVLRNACAAMLINDLDRLREDLLLWQKTITKAFKVRHILTMTHTFMPKIIEQFLTPEEFDVVQPVLQLNQAVLAE
ncbi:MAG: allophycocyanin [Cyanobacteria bacterium P01_E01_bin.35]